jgi:hypothetical protein
MFSIPLNPKLNELQFKEFLAFSKKHKNLITDVYVTIRIKPFIQDAMGDVLDPEQANNAISNALLFQHNTGIPISATFNDMSVPPTEQNLDIFIQNFKPLYEAGIKIVTLPHTIWMLSGKIQENFPDLYVKNTILRVVQRPNEVVELAKAGFSYINLDRDLMRDKETLLKIKEAKEYCIEKYGTLKISILANEGCWGNCPVQDEHFEYNFSRDDHFQPTYFLTNLSKSTCPKWELDDTSFELKKANVPPWRADWDELMDCGIDVFKMHGRESISRHYETINLIERYGRGEDILFENFNEYLENNNLENSPINVWRKKIKTCKFDCWKCNYCENVVKSRADKTNTLVTHMNKALSDAISGKSKVSDTVLDIKGLTSHKVKHLLNNICNIDDCRYLEVGSYIGATLISAIDNNDNCKAIAIDNWSTSEIRPLDESVEFVITDNPKAQFKANIASRNVTLIDMNAEDVEALPFKINTFFYDGDHETQSHITIFNKLNKYFDEEFIVIIDDYNWLNVQDAVHQLSRIYDITYSQALHTAGEDKNDFWNGIFVGIFKKKRMVSMLNLY